MTPAFYTKSEVAARLGYSASHFGRTRERLEREGFPKVDPLLGRYLKADVEAWIDNRSSNSGKVDASKSQGVNTNAL